MHIQSPFSVFELTEQRFGILLKRKKNSHTFSLKCFPVQQIENNSTCMRTPWPPLPPLPQHHPLLPLRLLSRFHSSSTSAGCWDTTLGFAVFHSIFPHQKEVADQEEWGERATTESQTLMTGCLMRYRLHLQPQQAKDLSNAAVHISTKCFCPQPSSCTSVKRSCRKCD